MPARPRDDWRPGWGPPGETDSDEAQTAGVRPEGPPPGPDEELSADPGGTLVNGSNAA